MKIPGEGDFNCHNCNSRHSRTAGRRFEKITRVAVRGGVNKKVIKDVEFPCTPWSPIWHDGCHIYCMPGIENNTARSIFISQLRYETRIRTTSVTKYSLQFPPMGVSMSVSSPLKRSPALGVYLTPRLATQEEVYNTVSCCMMFHKCGYAAHIIAN